MDSSVDPLEFHTPPLVLSHGLLCQCSESSLGSERSSRRVSEMVVFCLRLLRVLSGHLLFRVRFPLEGGIGGHLPHLDSQTSRQLVVDRRRTAVEQLRIVRFAICLAALSFLSILLRDLQDLLLLLPGSHLPFLRRAEKTSDLRRVRHPFLRHTGDRDLDEGNTGGVPGVRRWCGGNPLERVEHPPVFVVGAHHFDCDSVRVLVEQGTRLVARTKRMYLLVAYDINSLPLVDCSHNGTCVSKRAKENQTRRDQLAATDDYAIPSRHTCDCRIPFCYEVTAKSFCPALTRRSSAKQEAARKRRLRLGPFALGEESSASSSVGDNRSLLEASSRVRSLYLFLFRRYSPLGLVCVSAVRRSCTGARPPKDILPMPNGFVSDAADRFRLRLEGERCAR